MGDLLKESNRESLLPGIKAYHAGEPGAGDRLADALRDPVTREVASRLGDDHESVASDALLATLTYLDRDAGFAGDIRHLAVTIAGNRCSDLVRWRRLRRPPPPVADPARSILDEIEPPQRLATLQSALGHLTADCRRLLRAMYVDGLSSEAVRERLGLATVQGVHYRRSVCLRRVKTHVSQRLHGGSEPAEPGGRDATDPSGYVCIDPRLGGELWRLEDPATEAGQRSRLETHVAFCSSCRQQRDVEAATGSGLRSNALKLGSTAGRDVRRLRWLGGAGGIAIAAGLALMLLLPPTGTVVPGDGGPTIVGPVAGEVVPGSRPTLQWTAIDGISSYRVSLTAVAGDYVWQASVSEPTARVPEDRPLPSGDRFRVAVQPVPAHLAPPGGLRSTFRTGNAGAFVLYRVRQGSLAGQILLGLGLSAVVTGAILMGRRRSLASALGNVS